MTGSKTAKDLPTAGGTLSPRLMVRALTLVRRMKSSVAIKATIIPANMAPVPIFSKGRMPETADLTSLPSTATCTVLGIMTTSATSDSMAVASGLL